MKVNDVYFAEENMGKDGKTSSEDGKIRILVLEKNKILREALIMHLRHETGFIPLEEKLDFNYSWDIRWKIGIISPDVLILGVSFGSSEYLQLIREIKKEYCDLPVITYSMYPGGLINSILEEAGADKCLNSFSKEKEMINAVYQVLSKG